jgi:hypothetical protein
VIARTQLDIDRPRIVLIHLVVRKTNDDRVDLSNSAFGRGLNLYVGREAGDGLRAAAADNPAEAGQSLVADVLVAVLSGEDRVRGEEARPCVPIAWPVSM